MYNVFQFVIIYISNVFFQLDFKIEFFNNFLLQFKYFFRCCELSAYGIEDNCDQGHLVCNDFVYIFVWKRW